jgi:hypothetical protein
MRPVPPGDRTLDVLSLVLAATGLFGCGGSMGRDTAEMPSEAGPDEAGADEVSIPLDLPPLFPDAGSFSSERRLRDGTTVSDAPAVSHREGGSIIRSGTRSCETTRECFGLSCEFGPSPKVGVCVARCSTDEDCDVNEHCLGLETFTPGCFAACTSPTQCGLGFDCFDYHSDQQYTCLPTSWLLELDAMP